LPCIPLIPLSPSITSITSLSTTILALQLQKLITYLYILFYPLPLLLILLILYSNTDIAFLLSLNIPHIATMHIYNLNKLRILHIVFFSLPPHTLPTPAVIIPIHITSAYALTPLTYDTHNTLNSLLVCLTPFLASTTLLPSPFSSVDTLPTTLSSTSSALHTLSLPMP